MDDIYRKRFEVGDLICCNPKDTHEFLRDPRIHTLPFEVTRSTMGNSGKWLLDFVDAKGGKGSSWYQYRFLPFETPYDPTQAGDKEDDI